jgi:Protein of unknown function (DUF1638).
MNFKLIACKVLQRELSFLSAKSENYIDISFLRQGFHNTPELLQKILQNEIDSIEEKSEIHTCNDKPFDAILIGYGLCSNGIAGISSKKHTLVIPKAHDCITLILGNKEKYKEYFDAYSGGVYWYSAGWNENTLMPSKERYTQILNEYTQKFGEDNAEYLMEMEQGWMTKYSRCTYINWKDIEFKKQINFSKECARFMKWEYEQLEGSPRLLEDMLNGKWDNEKFIIVPPNCKVIPSNDSEILTFNKCQV